MKSDTDEITNILHPESNFLVEVQDHIRSSNVGIIEAVLHWCNKRSIEQEAIVPLIKNHKVLKKMLTEEAEKLNFLKKKKR